MRSSSRGGYCVHCYDLRAVMSFEVQKLREEPLGLRLVGGKREAGPYRALVAVPAISSLFQSLMKVDKDIT